MSLNKFQNPKNSYYFIAFMAFLLFSFLIYNPFSIDYSEEEWNNILWEHEQKIENSVENYFINQQEDLLGKLDKIKALIIKSKESDYFKRDMLTEINSEKFSGLKISIFNNFKIFAWTDNNNTGSDSLKIGNYEWGEIHFRHTNLYTNLSVIDSVSGFQILISNPVEKYYVLENEYSTPISLSTKFSELFNTYFRMSYYPEADLNSDNSRHSFDILNNFKNKIGVVTFNKLNRETEKNIEEAGNQNAIGVIIVVLFLGIVLFQSKIILSIRFYSLKFLMIFSLGSILRYLLYYFEIPSFYLSGWLVNREFFSSLFAFGIVSTPIEFFITVVFLLILALTGLKFAFDSYRIREKNLHPFLTFLSIPVVFVYLASLRGLGATIKSVIFDSSLLYFKSTILLPDLPSAFMHLNVLVFGFCSVIFSITLLILIFNLFKNRLNFNFLVFLFLVIQLLGIFYDVTQNEPQGTPFLRITYILVTFILAVLITNKKKIRKTYYVIFLFTASFFSINLLNIYNVELEKHSIKKTSLEFTAPDKSMVKSLIREVFNKAKNELLDENLYINEDINFNAYSFIIWSNSILHKNSLSSSVSFYDKSKFLMGSFSFKDSKLPKDSLSTILKFEEGESLKFDEPEDSSRMIIRGIMPIYHEAEIEGYLVIKVNFGLAKTIFSKSPKFLSDIKSSYRSPINLRDLKIFDFNNNELVNVFGDINPSLPIQKEIISTEFEEKNDQWKELKLGSAVYHSYILKYSSEPDKIIVTSLLKRDLTRNLFDFFRIFFVHTFFIFLIVIFMVLVNIRQGRFLRYSFKSKILISFLIISIIPLVFLAIYFRGLQDEKNTSAIFYKLKKRAKSVEQFINHKIETTELNLVEISNAARNDLGVEFSVFDESDLVYTSYPEYFEIGLLPDRLHPTAYSKLVLEGYNEFVNKENMDQMEFHSFYYYGNIGGNYLIIKVNDILNSYLLPMSGTEIDIFLFGSYSFASILILIISNFLANQISNPIRKLTEATKSVADGNLNLKLHQPARGEVKELMDGFNNMVEDLNRSRQELAEMERETAWKEMARQVAHEIKNPLTPMKLAVQQLMIAYNDKSPKFDDIFNKVTKTFDQQIDTLRNIANEFSNFARMPEPERNKIEITSLIKEVANLYIDGRAKINLLNFEQKHFIIGDEDQLKRTLINMIRNSIQASANEIAIEIISNAKIEIIIRDNGKGIPENIQDKIFEANFTTKVEGMGLGLNMAKRFIEKIGGEIFVKDTGINGTVFVLKFPEIN